MPTRLSITTAAFLMLGCSSSSFSSSSLCLRLHEGRNPPRASAPVGSTIQFRAGRLDILDECDRPPPGSVEWTSSAPTVGSVESTGDFHALSPGRVDVVLRSNRGEVRWPVTVIPHVSRIAIFPTDTVIPVGDTVEFRAAAYSDDGRLLSEARLGISAYALAETPPASLPAIGEVYFLGKAVAGKPPNTIRVFSRHSGAGYIVAKLVGRADSLLVRTVDR